MNGQTDQDADSTFQTGILLVNLGSPDAPTAPAVRSYLRRFLSDRSVVDAPRLPWWLVRNLLILPFRPTTVARSYGEIWTPDGSPLLAMSRRQADALARAVESRLGRKVPVALGMRYGSPSIATGIAELVDAGCRCLLFLPLYPQHSATTTGSVFDAAARALTMWGDDVSTRFVAGYSNNELYIRALAQSILEVWHESGPCDRLLISFHGLPIRYAELGDPYPDQCKQTADLLANEIGLQPGRWEMSFQSRFGREPWLSPSTEETLGRWGRQSVESVDVVCPGFAADCLETLHEIDGTGRTIFDSAGGGRFRYIPALNDRDDHIGFLAELAISNGRGWF